ncbi:antitoxin VapB family protein [Candidatus Micrarchaeota archaeon]|nr:antitoxin VapB family protein [Candidatus Micrarchaeota archaeon]
MAHAIMISDAVYKELTTLKRPGESYSKVIHKFIHPQKSKKNFMDFAGSWSFMSEKETKEMETVVKKVRKNWRKVPLKW